MKTIVTGGAGFIGSHLVDRLLREQNDVTVVDNFDPFYDRGHKEANLAGAFRNPRCRLVEVDIRDSPRVNQLLEHTVPDAIVHLAARAGVRPSITDPRGYTDVNVVGTAVWLEAASRIRPLPKFIYASSSSVYGERPEGPFRESDSVDRPVSPYAVSKRACELLAHSFHHVHGLPVTGLRYFSTYGPRNRPDLAIAKFARLIDRGEAIPMFGDGTSERDYTYVDDIVDGTVRAIERCTSHHLYNLGHSQPIALLEMIEAIGLALGKRPKIETLPEEPGDVGRTFAAIDRANHELGFSPQTPFRQGIARYVEWIRSGGEPSRSS